MRLQQSYVWLWHNVTIESEIVLVSQKPCLSVQHQLLCLWFWFLTQHGMRSCQTVWICSKCQSKRCSWNKNWALVIKTLTVETMFTKKFVVLLFVSLSRGHYVKKCCPEGERLAIPPKSEDTKVKCTAAGQSSQNPKDPSKVLNCQKF